MSTQVVYQRLYYKRRYAARMAEAKARLGGCCARCGVKDKLQIDHIDAATKSFQPAQKLWKLGRVRFEEELAKCQLLCQGCHAIKTTLERGRIVHCKPS